MLKASTKRKIEYFYMGRLYPLLVCAAVFLGYRFGIEVFLLPVVVLFACGAFWLCSSVRPLIAPLCMFLFAFSNGNSMFGEVGSDYYLTGWRIVVFGILVVFAAVSLIAFLKKNMYVEKLLYRKTPLLGSLLLLSAAFMLNGVMSASWEIGNIIYGSLQVLAFLIIYVIFYHGFSDFESADELGDYFSYITMLLSLLLISEMVTLFLTSPGVIENGQIIKSEIVFGWGVCNNAGFYIAVLIPMNFYGAYRSRLPIVQFTVATATLVAAVLTLSRNALLWSCTIYVFCLVCLMFFGNKRIFFRYAALTMVLCFGVFFLRYHEAIMTALTNYTLQGADDSGRFEIWRQAFEKFREAPIFGNGFHAELQTGVQTASFIPTMAHNTVFQLLFSMGIVGFVAYAIYRIRTLMLFLHRPSMLKTMLGASMLVLLGASMLDNFIFHVQPIFYYSIAMVIACKKDREDKVSFLLLKKNRR